MHPLRADTLRQLRHSMARLDASQQALTQAKRPLRLGVDALDSVLTGGLAFGALHELAPALPIDTGAATGFALALAARAIRSEHDLGRKPGTPFRDHARGHVLWIQSDFGKIEHGAPYGPGLDLFGLALDRLTVLTVAHTNDMLWAMEEALRCRAIKLVIGELPEERASDDGMAARRLSFTARDAGGLALLLRPHPAVAPSAAATRWQVSAAPSTPDEFGGLGHTIFALSLTKNRRGPCGRWLIAWDHHEHVFQPALSVGVAAASSDRSDRAPLVRTG
jgi:protein ImuA